MEGKPEDLKPLIARSKPPKRSYEGSLFPIASSTTFVGKNGQGKCLFARTASRSLVKLVVSFKCTECQKPFLSNPSPLTAHCGHHFCVQCVQDIKITDNHAYRTAEIYYCKSCGKYIIAPVPEKSETSFMPNEFLTGIFKALDEPGYRCKYCHQLHPRNNSVALASQPSQIACVWCAADKKFAHKLVPIGENATKFDWERLQSVDRSWHYEGPASGLIQCSSCTEPLCISHSDGPGNNVAAQLPCGHYQNDDCAPSKMDDLKTICNLCAGEITFTDVDTLGDTVPMTPIGIFTKRDNPPHDIRVILAAARLAMGELKKCKTCKKLHPSDNFEQTKKTECVWCTTEKKSAKM